MQVLTVPAVTHPQTEKALIKLQPLLSHSWDYLAHDMRKTTLQVGMILFIINKSARIVFL